MNGRNDSNYKSDEVLRLIRTHSSQVSSLINSPLSLIQLSTFTWRVQVPCSIIVKSGVFFSSFHSHHLGNVQSLNMWSQLFPVGRLVISPVSSFLMSPVNLLVNSPTYSHLTSLEYSCESREHSMLHSFCHLCRLQYSVSKLIYLFLSRILLG